MMRTKLSKAMALFLALVMTVSCFSLPAFAAGEAETADKGSSGRRSMAEWNEILNTSEYEEYISNYENVAATTETYTFDAVSSFVADESSSEAYVDVADGGVYTPDIGKVVWKINVPKEGLYTLVIECFPGNYSLLSKADGTTETSEEIKDGEMSTDVERILYINGKVPFSEARSITVSKRWAPEYMLESGRFDTDAAGNELRPDNMPATEWINYTVKDSAGYYSEPLEFYFKAGENTIALEATREMMNVKSFTLKPAEKVITYEEYLAKHAGAADVSASVEPVKFEAELPLYQSDESIYPLTDRTSAITSPQDPAKQLLNFMGGAENFKTVGQWVEYKFEVPESGFYTIAMRSKQNDLSGMFASRTLYIDGTLPFAECASLRFDYSEDWKCKSLTDGTNEFKFYLEAGEHTLRLEVSLGQLADVISNVESSLTNINNCYLDIMKLTGADPDEYRDYGFGRLMPETISTMLDEAENLTAVSELLTELCGEKGSQTATLDKVAFLLDKMGKNEDEIAPNLDNLKSYIGTLGTWLNSVRSQPVRMDYFLIQPVETKMPKANASFGQAFMFEIKAFFASFTTDYSTMGAKDVGDASESIEVWTVEGRDQAKILKNLVSSSFTSESGIGVDVKLVAAGTLLPSVLSGQGPDAYLGAAGVDVINYAIRDAVIPLNDFEGFEELVIEQYNPSSVVPVTLYGKTYGLPERAGFYMMFVRIDILASLGLEVPETWDDLLAMLPVLQANNMSIGLNKEYDIFLYQMGGDRFADDGMRCGLDSNVALEAFEMYTRFFTDYSFPYTFDGPNRFRTGEMPILIADYSTTYNQLTVFATEIDGLWEMVPLPGVYRDDGSYHHEAFNTVAATIMLHGTENQEATWKFMKWYCGKDAQAAYGSDLVTTIGQAAKYNTANKLAIAEMPWTTSEREALTEQFNHLSAVTNYPGAYIFARYLNFALLSVVNDGQDPVVELQGYVSTINKEISRKREEFDLATLENGKTLEDSPEVKAVWDKWRADNELDPVWEAWLAGEEIPEAELNAWLAEQK